MGAAAMDDDSIALQSAKVRHAVYGDAGEAVARVDPTTRFAATMQEAAVTGKTFVEPSGMTDEDVRKREHPEEFPEEIERRRRQHEIERTPPPGCIGVADEYGTIWSGEPGAAGSRRIGDLVLRYDEETSWVVIEK